MVALSSIAIAVRGHLSTGKTDSVRLYASEDHQRRLHIFGKDNRRPLSNPTKYPYSALGLVVWKNHLECTGSLIGPRFVLTAAECVLDASGKVLGKGAADGSFTAMFGSKDPMQSRIRRVHRQSDYWKRWTTNTYVILELDESLAEELGVLLLPTLSKLDQSIGNAAVQMVQYADDTRQAKAKMNLFFERCTCHFPGSFKGAQYLLHHDCDTASNGSPGAPLLVRYTRDETYIIGIHSNAAGSTLASGEEITQTFDSFSHAVANRGVLAPFVQMQLEALLSAVDSEEPQLTTPAPTPSIPTTGAEEIPQAKLNGTNADSVDEENWSGSPVSDGDRQDAVRAPNNAVEASPSSQDSANEVSTATSNGQIPAVAIWMCILFVAGAWIAVIFVAFRHIRRRNELNQNELATPVSTTSL